MTFWPGSSQIQFILSIPEQSTRYKTGLAFEIINTSKRSEFSLKRDWSLKKNFFWLKQSLKEISHWGKMLARGVPSLLLALWKETSDTGAKQMFETSLACLAERRCTVNHFGYTISGREVCGQGISCTTLDLGCLPVMMYRPRTAQP